MEIKIRLMKMNKTQAWLIDEVKKALPNKYIDGSNFYKIITGEINSPEIESAVSELLGIERKREE